MTKNLKLNPDQMVELLTEFQSISRVMMTAIFANPFSIEVHRQSVDDLLEKAKWLAEQDDVAEAGKNTVYGEWGQQRQTFYSNPWYSFDDFKAFLDAVSSGRWTWYSNSDFKYVNIRIDTRNGAVVIKDRDGKRASMNQLMCQYDSNANANGMVPLAGYVDPMKLTTLEGKPYVSE